MAERSTTERGFIIYDEFTDTYGSDVRVQESSHADGDRCWIFTGDRSAHLNVEQAKRVRDALDAFISEHAEVGGGGAPQAVVITWDAATQIAEEESP